MRNSNQWKNPSAPLNMTWWIANILAVAGIIMYFIPSVSQYAFWPVFVSAVLLLLLQDLRASDYRALKYFKIG